VTIRVQQEAFDPWQEVVAYQTQARELAGGFGATAVFVGSMRDMSHGEAVSAMTLEHYPGMTEAYLGKIRAEAHSRWEILESLVIHRYGPLTPNEPIVLVAVWAVHRDAAFAACRYLIDELKTRAPFWKQETTPAGARWVKPD
jgi:molybdopterin synthase catalytic subunit